MDNQKKQTNFYLQKQREKKHKQIMNAIYNYKRSPQDIKMLDKVRQATRMQIDLRYRNCSHNQHYVFPASQQNIQNEQDLLELNLPSGAMYDLHNQSSIIQKTISTKTLSLDASRRVKSLQKQHVGDQDQIINKFRRKNVQNRQSPTLEDYNIRKNSLRDKLPRDRSLLKLPQLRKGMQKQKNNINLQQIVGKKIHTQGSSPDSKRLAKYLKGPQTSKKQMMKGQPKKFFLQQC